MHIFQHLLLIHDNDILEQKLYGTGNTITHVINIELREQFNQVLHLSSFLRKAFFIPAYRARLSKF